MMDSESCGTETGQLRIIKVENGVGQMPEYKTEEITHECNQEPGHAGHHVCLNCGIIWDEEATC
jgi:hypothetical protein